jgi:hypothetical protein
VAHEEGACSGSGLARLGVVIAGGLLASAGSGFAFRTIEDEDALEVATPFLGCPDDGALTNTVGLGVLSVIDQLACANRAWADLLTVEMVASSLAYGHGLDDLAPEDVGDLAAAAAACVPDRQWWIDDLAIDLDREFEVEVAGCVAIAFVDVVGVDEIIRRRLLTVALWSIPRADIDRMDLGRRGQTGEELFDHSVAGTGG